MNIGERIKNRRIELDLTVDELAKRLDKNRATIYRYEKGDIEHFPITVIEPLAAALNTTPAYLMGWDNVRLQKNIKNRRMQMGLSQEELAERIGYPDPSIISDIENGKLISYHSELDRIASALNTSSEILMGWVSDYEFKDTVEKKEEFTPEVRAAARGMMDLSEEDRKSAMDMINYLRQKGREAKDN